VHIRRLTPADAAAFQALRLQALRDTPSAFASSYEEEKDFPLALLEERLALRADRGSFGAFEDGPLIGMVVLGRPEHRKLRHKALIWSLYVAAPARGRGTGRALLAQALALARAQPEVQYVNVGVTAGNTAAIRLYESAGFRCFGREPGALLIDGQLHDELHLSLRVGAI
jgi:ribosomal protein S18 acetylase RimI-like enzyme